VVLAIFYGLAALSVLSAIITAFSRNIVYSAFALFGALAGVAGIYALLGADFLFIIQVFIYIGGILVVTIFAVMLTQGVADVNVSNRAVGVAPALAIVSVAGAVMLYALQRSRWVGGATAPPLPTTYGIGNALLSGYILPFEIASVVLLAGLVGAIVISRQETRS
jgi:NADH:ubiquinone oxidoreductase subunit 6 (subunit J)